MFNTHFHVLITRGAAASLPHVTLSVFLKADLDINVISTCLFQNNTYDAMELKEIRMSPVMGIRNNQTFTADVEAEGAEPPNLRMAPSIPRTYVSHGYLPSNLVRRRNSNSQPKKRRLFSNFKQKAKSIKVKIPRVQDVNTIDKYSRLMFPLLFLAFNGTYWVVYLFV